MTWWKGAGRVCAGRMEERGGSSEATGGGCRCGWQGQATAGLNAEGGVGLIPWGRGKGPGLGGGNS